MKTYLLMPALCVSIAGCHSKQHTVTRDLGEGAVLSVTVQPYPLVVGEAPEIYATLRVQRSAGTGCRVQLRQYLSETGATNASWVDIPEQSRSGIYRRLGQVLSNDGNWRFEFDIRCGEDYVWRGVKFDFPVVSQAG